MGAGKPSHINIYQGDGRTDYAYNNEELKRAMAHEFGHSLGLNDYYFEGGDTRGINSIMGDNMWKKDDQNINYLYRVEAINIARMVLAQKTGIPW